MESISNELQQPIEPCSRRRLVFRNPSIRGKPSNSSEQSVVREQCERVPSINSPSSRAFPGYSSGNSLITAEQEQRKRPVTWSFKESMAFYDALKQVGKDFEAISKILIKKKIQRDKQQVRNYYFNVFKLGSLKAQLDENDWKSVPQDARELFVVLNSCEWKKRTNGAEFDPSKFRLLILDGIVSMKIKRRKSPLITIRTPHCPTLLRFFPQVRRASEVPTSIEIKLLPLRNLDRVYVCQCEQNPFVQISANVNHLVSNIFDFLDRKWKRYFDKLTLEHRMPVESPEIRLFSGENEKIHKVVVEINDDSWFPLVSLRKLTRDGVGERQGLIVEENNSFDQIGQGSIADSNVICLSGSAIKEVFEIDEEKIRAGLTRANVGKASLLELFYLLGMKKTITLNYEINDSLLEDQQSQPWYAFVSLVNREYDNLMARSTAYLQQQEQTTETHKSADNEFVAQTEDAAGMYHPTTSSHLLAHQQQMMPQSVAVSKAKQIAAQSIPPSLADEERSGFMDQIKKIRSRKQAHQPGSKAGRPKRQIKVIVDEQASKRIRTSTLLPHSTVTKNYLQPDNLQPFQQQQQFYILDGSAILNQPSTTLNVASQPQQPVFYIISAPEGAATVASDLNDIIPEQQRRIQMHTAMPAELNQQSVTLPPTDFSHFTSVATNSSGLRHETQTKILVQSMEDQASVRYFDSSSSTPVQHHQREKEQQANVTANTEYSLDLITILNDNLDRYFLRQGQNDSTLLNAVFPSNDGSPSKSLSTAPDTLINHTVEQMINQNSVDFCRNFELLTKMTTKSGDNRKIIDG